MKILFGLFGSLFILRIFSGSHSFASPIIPAMSLVFSQDKKRQTYVDDSFHKPLLMSPAGDIPSKMINSAATPPEGCRTRSEMIDHNDGTTTEVVTIICNKKIVRDKNDQIKKESDTSKPKYKKSVDRFIGSSSTDTDKK